MGRFRTGLIAGSILGIIGVSMAMSDRQTRRRVVKDGRIMRKGAGKILDKLDIM
ncbi:MAG: hypothetical protein LUC97_06135 [Clostridiales bacterium]|nr:hypothetical protein [Clostridiales bacterium]MCD8215203.1 hypothetical protein [Clostridiales bacterium]